MSASDQAKPQCPCLVVFAAQGIQTYILRSDKLREIVGASELVESMASELLDDTLRQIGIADPNAIVLSRAAGAARILFPLEAQACRFALIWPLLVARHAPGLTVSVAMVPVKGHPLAAIIAADDLLPLRRAYAAVDLPEAGPFTERHSRSGRPVADEWKGEDGPADHETGRKRDSSESGRYRLLGKILGPEASATEVWRLWPLEMEDIADEHNGLAIFHADGNGLGKSVIALLHALQDKPADEALEHYRDFCRGVEESTVEALKCALDEIMAETRQRRESTKNSQLKFPFRPLVCAGDDVTVILRDKDAMPFAETFLAAIQTKVRHRLSAQGLDQFTACGALVYMRPKFPFADAYSLSESMCNETKRAVDRKHTALSFVRVASSLPGEYSDFIERERKLDENHLLTMNPYLVGTAADGHPSLKDLRDLEKLTWKLPRGALRETVASAYRSVAEADTGFNRFLQVLESSDKSRQHALKPDILAAFRKLTGNPADSLWTAKSPHRTPLYDALELKAVSASPLP